MKILFVHKQILFPHDTGGKIRALNILRHLANWHDVTYLCNVRPGEDPYLEPMRSLGLRLEAVPVREVPRGSFGFYRGLAANLASRDPFTITRNYDPALHRRARQLATSEEFDMIICDTVQMARHVFDLPAATKILFQHNVEAQILERHARAGQNLKARFMAIQAKKMRRFEEACGPRFDAVIAISEPDRRAFERDYGWSHAQAIETSVDLEYFQPDHTIPSHPGRVVFVGSMDWLPNEDGVRHFVRHSWPRIRHSVPGATFQIVGRKPTAEVRRLDGVDGVEVTGAVPDVRPYLAKAEVVVVPLLVGGGTRLKIYEAMAMGKAVVSTTLGAEGLASSHGENILLADDPTDLADIVSRLLAQPFQRESLGSSALHMVRERFDTETIARQFESICLTAASSGTPSRSMSGARLNAASPGSMS